MRSQVVLAGVSLALISASGGGVSEPASARCPATADHSRSCFSCKSTLRDVPAACPRVAELMYPVLLYLRSLTIGHVFLQIAPWRRVCLARACPRVPRLMYPSRTRGSLSV